MSKYLADILLLLLATLAASCDPHEWPELPETELYVDLVFDFSNLPIYKDITITHSSADTRAYRQQLLQPEMRYQVRCYALSADSVTYELMPDAQFTFLNANLQDPNYRCRISLKPGKYKVKVWADYVNKGSTADAYYATTDFRNIAFTGDATTYTGSTELRDSFEGEHIVVAAETPDRVSPSNVSAHIMMQRPFAKFQFVTTDLADFVGKYLGITDPEAISRLDLSDYRILFRYTGYLPTNYNMLTGRPFDAAMGYQFFSTITSPTATEATLGYDYIFVNGQTASVSVAVGIYSREGLLLSFSDPIEVPLVRNHLTIVRDRFLTQGGSGNVGINPQYDGNFNIYIE